MYNIIWWNNYYYCLDSDIHITLYIITWVCKIWHAQLWVRQGSLVWLWRSLPRNIPENTQPKHTVETVPFISSWGESRETYPGGIPGKHTPKRQTSRSQHEFSGPSLGSPKGSFVQNSPPRKYPHKWRADMTIYVIYVMICCFIANRCWLTEMMIIKTILQNTNILFLY